MRRAWLKDQKGLTNNEKEMQYLRQGFMWCEVSSHVRLLFSAEREERKIERHSLTKEAMMWLVAGFIFKQHIVNMYSPATLIYQD